MNHDLNEYIKKFRHQHRNHRHYLMVVLVLAACTIFAVNWRLHVTGIAMTSKPECGMEEHVHTDKCYKKVLVCGKEESSGTDGHHHTDSCYEEEKTLTCGKEETDGDSGHSHTDACYETEKTLICGNEDPDHEHTEECYSYTKTLVCGETERPAVEAHHHTDACYTVEKKLICGKEESDGTKGHTHTDACYEEKLVCGKKEHTHTTSCYSNISADVENSGEWESTLPDDSELTGVWSKDILTIAESQLGYKESTTNYVLDSRGKKKGYSRYGAWYGNSYGDWCAMFVSFCINYSDIPTNAEKAVEAEDGTEVYMPIGAGCQAWIQRMNTEETPYYYALNDKNSYDLINGEDNVCFNYQAEMEEAEETDTDLACTKYHPQSGDLIFFNWDKEADSDHVGIISWIEYNNDGSIKLIHTIEGNAGNCVKEKEYKPTSAYIMGFARLPENPDAPEEAVNEAETEETAASADASAEAQQDEETADESQSDSEAAVDTELSDEDLADIADELDGADETEIVDESAATGETGEEDPENTEGEYVADITQTFEGEDYTVTVTYGDNIGIPENAELLVEEYAKDSETYQNRYTEASELYDWESDTSVTRDFRLFNIGLYLDGEAVEPTGVVDVSITYKNNEADGNTDYQVTHYTEEEPVELEITTSSEDGETSIDFSTDGFSDFGLMAASTTLLAASSSSSDTHPRCALPDTVDVNHQLMYSLDAATSNVTYVEGVQYTVYNSDGTVYNTYTQGTSLKIDLGTLPAGTYTIAQTYVPDGYVLTPQTSTFTVVTDVYTNVGVFYVYKEGDYGLKADKTAEVVDYINRTYQVDITASTNLYTYDFKAINYSIVVDQSNSMLFPAELTDTGKTVKLYSGSNVTANNTALNNAGLDTSQVYYIIADEDTTSTVYAIYYDSVNKGWCYQDAAYYAKAQFNARGEYENLRKETDTTHGDFTVVYATYNSTTYSAWNSSYTECATGGGSIKYPASTLAGDLTTSGTTFTIYTGSEYDRLHELQEAVSQFAQELAALSPTSTLDIVTFDKTVEKCYTDITMNPAGVTQIISIVNEIATAGGTRQDRALNHLIGSYGGSNTANHTTNHLSSGDIVILVTDGAPVNSSGDSGASIDANKTAATAVKNKGAQLITIGLSTTNVKGGSDALDLMASTTVEGVSSVSEDSAQSPATWFFDATKTGQLTDIMVNKVLFKLATKRNLGDSADIKDVISDSFYPIDISDNSPLSDGTKIALDGTVDSDGPGTVHYDSTNKQWYVTWDCQALGDGSTTTTEGSTTTKYTWVDGTELSTSGTYYLYYSDYTSSDTPAIYTSNPYGSSYSATTTGAVYGQMTYSGGKWTINWYYWTRYYGSYTYGTWHWKQSSYQYPSTDVTSKVTVTDTTTGTTVKSNTWHGTVYLKAKEDFIGGNTIDTNKSASVTLKENSATATLPTPTVNVRLLPLEGFESEETVFLGDEVNNIKAKIEALLEKTVFAKINPYYGSDNVLNYKTGATAANGCYDETFTIAYAMAEHGTPSWSLDGTYSDPENKYTEDITNWQALVNGETIKVEYTYDDASSHGAVGYFEFTLTKEVVKNETSTYDDHTTSVVGEDVEQYILSVTYTAYRIEETDDEGNEREKNVHNSEYTTPYAAVGPGTEVGSVTASDDKTLEENLKSGVGTETVKEIHHVHVIDGEIYLTKVLDDSLVSTDPQTFEFTISILDSDGNVSWKDYATVEVTVPANSTTGTIKITNLPRNDYLVEEVIDENTDDFEVDGVAVVTDTTNCGYVELTSASALKFQIGTYKVNTTVSDVITWLVKKDATTGTTTGTPEYMKSVYVDGYRYVYSYPYTDPDLEPADKENAPALTITKEVEEKTDVTTYSWPSGTVISTDTSGTQYVKLDSTTTALDASHTNYGVLTQDASGNWTVTWTTWTDGVATTTYDWPSGTVISTDTSGTQYVKLDETTDDLDAAHTSYGVLTQDASGNWSVTWTNWTSKEVTKETTGSTTYDQVTLNYVSGQDFSSYTNSDYYYLNGTTYELITGLTCAARNNGKLTITTTAGSYTESKTSGSSGAYVYTDKIYKATTSGSSTETTTEWSSTTSATPAVDTSKIPTTTTTGWSKTTSASAKAVSSMIPSTTTTQTNKVTKTVGNVICDPVAFTDVKLDALSVGHGMITNTSPSTTAEISVEKVWTNGKNTVDAGAESVTVQLYKVTNGDLTTAAKYGNVITLNSTNKWTETVKELSRKETIDGVTYKYSYYFQEVNVPAGYQVLYSNEKTDGTLSPVTTGTVTVKNVKTEKTSLTVTKKWMDGDKEITDESTLPDNITVTLYQVTDDVLSSAKAYGDDTTSTVTLSKSNDWTATVDDLPLNEISGNAVKRYSYYFQETVPEGYVETYSNAVTTNGVTTFTPMTSGEETITNTLYVVNETTDVTAQKVWEDSSGNTITDASSKPEVTLVLYKVIDDDNDNPVKVQTVKLNKDNTWTQTITGLPKSVTSGKTTHSYTYFFKETNVPSGYEVSYSNTTPVDSGTITVTNKAETGIRVSKQWLDSNGDEVYKGSGSIEYVLHQVATTTGGSSSESTDNVTLTINVENKWNTTTAHQLDQRSVPKGSTVTIYYTAKKWYYGLKVNGTVVKDDNGAAIGSYSYTFTINADTVICLESNQDKLEDQQANVDLDSVVVDSSGVVTETEPVSSDPVDTTYDTGTLDASNNWTKHYSELPASVTNANGSVTTYKYYVEETTTLQNYETPTYSNNNIDQGTITIVNKSNPTYELPKTGGIGTTKLTLAGLLLMAGSAILLILKLKGKMGRL